MSKRPTPALDCMLKAILHASPDGVLLVDGLSNVLFHNQRFFDLWQMDLPADGHYSGEQLIELALQQLAEPDAFLAGLSRYLDEANRQLGGVDLLHFRNGCILERHTGPLFDAAGAHLGRVWYFRDVTQQKQAENQARELAFHDSLTRLPNRRLLRDRLDLALAASRRSRRWSALLFVDLDRFKPVNDAHGHEVGDQLLMEVARRTVQNLRAVDTVARFGGDEFVVLLGELDCDPYRAAAHARAVAEKLRQSLALPYALRVQPEPAAGAAPLAEAAVTHACTASIGIALFDGGSSVAEALRRADLAMYQVKAQGGNGIAVEMPDALHAAPAAATGT